MSSGPVFQMGAHSLSSARRFARPGFRHGAKQPTDSGDTRAGGLVSIVSVKRDEPAADASGPAIPYDEMLAADGKVHPHYAALDGRLSTLSPQELAERQRTQERFFLLQGITFTVYGAESSTERIIPTDLLPRIISADEWATIERGLTQRLTALNLFLADIYSAQQILMDGVV